MKFAPIVIFAFNRPVSFQRTVESLCNNIECKDSDLFVFVDGPRDNHPEEMEKVLAVRGFAEHITGFHSINYRFSDHNRGLADSVISGVTEVINCYGSVIVLEDDLVVASNFLLFMNEALTRYKESENIFSVCGYTNKIRIPKYYQYDVYISSRSSSWGWGTWKNRWEKVDWKLSKWDNARRNKKAFNAWGGSDCYHMLKRWKKSENNSWAIRFVYSQFVNHGWSVFPCRSLVKNNGFDGTGTNCHKYSRFKYDFDDTNKQVFNWSPSKLIDLIVLKRTLSYESVRIRIWSRIMYIIKG
jgi:hypothetical protein